MSHIRSSCVLEKLALGLLLIGRATIVQAAPVVQSITPNAARADDVLKVEGSGFKGTRDVYFVSGSAIKSAKFKVIDDDQLEVTFPEYYRGTGSASIIVVGANSVTVAMSNDMKTFDGSSKTDGVTAPFLNVIKDGIVERASGVTVVGDGGIVSRVSESPVCLVQRSGTVGQFHGALLFHEPGATFNNGQTKSPRTPQKLIPVHQITISPNVDPILIKSPDKPQPFAKHPPVLTSLSHSLAEQGDIVTCKGKNFSQVSNIYFASTTGGVKEAGFKAVDDSTLRVEVPQNVGWRQFLLIVNPAGCAVSISDNPATPFHNLDPREARLEESRGSFFRLESVHTGQLSDTGSGGRIVIVEKGGTVTQTGGGCLLLVRNGGRVGANVGAECTVLHESDAIVPSAGGGQRLSAGVKLMDMGKFVFTPRPLKLDVEAPR